MNKKIFLALGIVLILLSGCKENYITLVGNTQGTKYEIVYNYDKKLDKEIDSILKRMDMIFSTYNPNSVVSKINRNDTVFLTDEFIEVFNKAMEISENSNGLFDITVGPLVRAYGFGPDGHVHAPPMDTIDSLLKFIGYKKIRIYKRALIKDNPHIQIDMNAIAQGYTVDQVGNFFDKLGITDYYIYIGGEVLVKGKNEFGEAWRIGIERPIENTQMTDNPISLILAIKNEHKAVATSGNYRKFYVENGVKFTHTVNPITGAATKDSLLSVTILASDCTTADGYATACLVSGFKKAFELVNKIDDIEGYFIYIDKNGVYKIAYTDGFKKYIVQE